jgi:SAM-dependent methyltransferase
VQTETGRPAGTTGLVGPGRQGLIWPLLAQALASVSTGDRPARVLDCGGGSGSFAVPLATTGAHVTVVDISADALATLSRRADEAGVAERVRPVQGDVEGLAEAVAEADFDLVLAHGILQAVDQPGRAFAAFAGAVRPGGRVSILVSNPVAGVLSRALAGDLPGALHELRDTASGASVPAVEQLCRDHGLLIEQTHGIGVFSDLVPGRALDAPGTRDLLAALEAESADRHPFLDIAARVHLLARRSDG